MIAATVALVTVKVRVVVTGTAARICLPGITVTICSEPLSIPVRLRLGRARPWAAAADA